jgi:hypothetical protein
VACRTHDAPLRRELTLWLLVALAGTLVAIGGWGVLSTADLYYSPGQVGIGNRINVVAGVGLALLAVAVIRLSATLALSAVPRDRRVATAVLTGAVAAAIGGAYLDQLGSDRGDWWRARRLEGEVLNNVHSLGRPPSGSTVIAQGFPLYNAPGVPVFAASWDLDGALKLLWNDPTIRGIPAAAGAIGCTPAGVAVPGVTTIPLPYNRLLLVDVAKHSASRLDTPGQCRAVASPQ